MHYINVQYLLTYLTYMVFITDIEPKNTVLPHIALTDLEQSFWL